MSMIGGILLLLSAYSLSHAFTMDAFICLLAAIFMIAPAPIWRAMGYLVNKASHERK